MHTFRYKILVAPFPFGDLTAKKTRPVLCLTDEIGKYEELVLAYITTKVPSSPLSTDILLSTNDSDFKQTKLLFDSAIRLHKLLTLPKDIIIGELGHLSSDLIEKVNKKLNLLFKI